MLWGVATGTMGHVPTSTPWSATTRRRTSGRTCPPCTAAGGLPVSLRSTAVSMQWGATTQVRDHVQKEVLESAFMGVVLAFDTGQWLCEVERFDPSTKQWSLIAPMQHSRTGVAVTALRGKEGYGTT